MERPQPITVQLLTSQQSMAAVTISGAGIIPTHRFPFSGNAQNASVAPNTRRLGLEEIECAPPVLTCTLRRCLLWQHCTPVDCSKVESVL